MQQINEKPVSEIEYLGFDCLGPVEKKISYIMDELTIDDRALLIRNTRYHPRNDRDAEIYIEKLIRNGTDTPSRDYIWAASAERPDEFEGCGVRVLNCEDGEIVAVYDANHFTEGTEDDPTVLRAAREAMTDFYGPEYLQGAGMYGNEVGTKYQFKNPDKKQDALLGVVRFIV